MAEYLDVSDEDLIETIVRKGLRIVFAFAGSNDASDGCDQSDGPARA